MHGRAEKIKGALLLVLATFLWGSSFTVTKGSVDSFPPMLLVGARMVLGGLVLAAVFYKKMRGAGKRELLCCTVLGVVYASGMMLQTYGIKCTEAGRSAFVTAAYCIITPFLEWAVLKNRPKAANLLAAAVCMAGIGLIVLKGDFSVDSGDLYTLAGSVCFALEIVLFGKFVSSCDDTVLSAGMLVAGGLFALVLSVLFEAAPTGPVSGYVLPVLYLGAACSGVPMLLQGKSQKVLAPSVMSVLLGFEAVFAAIISVIVLHEVFTGRVLIGCGLVFLSAFAALL